jgi:hypothetical protein
LRRKFSAVCSGRDRHCHSFPIVWTSPRTAIDKVPSGCGCVNRLPFERTFFLLLAKGEPVGLLEVAVIPGKDDSGFCPHCRKHFKIVAVKFAFRATQVVAACPNCAFVCSNGFHSPTSDQSLPERPNPGIRRLNIGAWEVVGFVFGALLTAAALRHGLHVHGGMSPETIRAYTLILLLIALPVVAWRINRRHQRRARSRR